MTPIPEFGANPNYPYYQKEGGELPPGIKPPLDDYRNMDLCGLAGEAAAAYLAEHDIDETLAKETVYGIVALVNRVLEDGLVEWKLPALVDAHNFPSDERMTARLNLYVEDLMTRTGFAAIKALRGSPLAALGNPFQVQLALAVATSVGQKVQPLDNWTIIKE